MRRHQREDARGNQKNMGHEKSRDGERTHPIVVAHLGNKRTCAELNSFKNSSGTRVAVIVTRGGAVTATEGQIAHRVLPVDDDLIRGPLGVPEDVIEITYACDP